MLRSPARTCASMSVTSSGTRHAIVDSAKHSRTNALVSASFSASVADALLLLCVRRAAWSRAAAARAGAAAAERRLQQVRERVHVAQLAVLHTKQVRIGRAAAAGGAAGAERAEHRDGSTRLVDDEPAVGDVHAARHADIAAVRGRSVTGVRAPL